MPPRFHPRDFMVDPSKFGEDPDAKWKRGTSLTEMSRVAAAYAQHHAAIEVREKLSQLKKSGEWLAQQVDQNPQMVRRKLDGDYPALPEDILAWAIVLDDVLVIYAPGDIEHLVPPAQRGRHVGIPAVSTDS